MRFLSGDKVLVTGPTTGALIFDAEEIRFELQQTNQVQKGDRFSMKTPSKVRPSDKLYKLVASEM
jgi:putative protease